MLAGAMAGCDRPGLSTHQMTETTPLPPRPGNPDEIRVGIFGPPDGSPVPPNPLTEAVARVSGASAVVQLRLRLVTIRSNRFCDICPEAIDLDTRRFTHDPEKIPAWFLSVALLATGRPEDIPDLVLFDDLTALRYAAAHHLVIPIQRLLDTTAGPVADAWPGAMDVTQALGQTWAIPLAVRPLILTYRPAAFEAQAFGAYRHSAVALPTNDWTWDDMLKAARTLTPPSPPPANPLLASGPTPHPGEYGYFATAPDSLPVFVWQAGGDVIEGSGRQARCALERPAALEAQRFIFDLVHRDQVSPRQASNGAWTGSAAMQLGPATGSDYVLPPRGKEAATGYSLTSATCLAVTARARDPERAVRAALGMAAAVQGQYDWPVSRSAAERRAAGGGPAATALAALRMARPPGLVADVRDAVESAALAIANEITTPEAATLNDRHLVAEEAKSACTAIDKALRALL